MVQLPYEDTVTNEARFSTPDGCEGVLLLDEEPGTAGTRRQRVELIDLSRRGVKFCATGFIPVQAKFRLAFTIDPAVGAVTATGETRWTRQDDAATIVGCALTTPLPEMLFTGGAHVGMQKIRYRTVAEVDGFIDRGEDRAQASLKNSSLTGFCLETNRAFSRSSKLRYVLRSPQRVTIVANIRWHEEVAQDAFLVGCSFLNTRDYGRLAHAQEHAHLTTVPVC